MSYSDIPAELRQYKSWCLWRYEDHGGAKPTKVPYQVNGHLANVNDPNTWTTYEEVIITLDNSHVSPDVLPYSGIGFVFSEYDPFCFIDLDTTNDPAVTERQLKVAKEFNSYSEVSPSGKGLHIIIKGSIPNGRRRSSIEIYSSQRYATMTGNIYNSAPVNDYNDLVNQLWAQMGAGPASFVYTGDEKAKHEDKEIIELASKAVNGEKFTQLLIGHWQDLYPSQSEADLAFIDILAFYTQNREQITRIFRQSPLGARPKAKRNDYINSMINRSFDKMLPQLDIDGFRIQIEDFKNANGQVVPNSLSGSNSHSSANINGAVAQRLEPSAHNGLVVGSSPASTTNNAGSFNGRTTPFEGANVGSSPAPAAILSDFQPERDFKLVPPPGLVGEIARFLYDASPRQIAEIAIAGAIGLMAGVCGKAYNISGTGVNQYIILLSPTGSGKEGMASGISKLMKAIKFICPTSSNFIGPGEISSGQALARYINKHPCFVSIIGEFGIKLSAICDPRASGHEKKLYSTLLDLYNKSGHHQDYKPTIYSETEKNIPTTEAPAFSLLAESTPETFYEVINESMISSGLMPRFLLIEYKGKTPYLNRKASNVEPSLYLVDQFSSLVAQCEQIMHAKKVITIGCDDKADKVLTKFGDFATDRSNSSEREFIKALWSRAHMKALKIAALVSVGINPIEPIITTEYVDQHGVVFDPVQWAIDLVVNDIRVLSSKFEQGEIGSGTSELKQLQFARRIIKEYIDGLEWEKAEKYKVLRGMFDDKVIPGSYLSRRLAGQHSFRMDRMGSTIAIKRALQALIDADTIREIPPSQLLEKYGTRQKAYVVSNAKGLGD